MKKFQVSSMIAILILWLIARVFLELQFVGFFSDASAPISAVVVLYVAAVILMVFIYLLPKVHSDQLSNLGILIVLPLFLLSIPAYFDFANKHVVQWNESRRLQEYYKNVEKTKTYYKGVLKQEFTYDEIIYYSDKSTIYSFSTTETPSLEHVKYLLNTIKPVDHLNIIVRLFNESEKSHWTMRFDKNKQIVRCEESSLFLGGNIYASLCK
ncbi:hypothetical protein [Paenibacillus mesotrionivorans]|uniref:Uncharacterized protein n=1 Tax=Paenibacillus mesotrionivorans TaxID=3160968 RepID=A0ACC7NZ42_9BACL